GDDGDSVYNMAKTLFSGGSMDGDIALAEAANSVRSFIKLANYGVQFPTNEYGEYVGYKTDHDPYCRATSIGPYTSKKMTEVLEKAVADKGITVIDKCQVIRILKDENGVVGLLAIDLTDPEKGFVGIQTPVVVMATGGPATVYEDSVYPLGHTGCSSLALNTGAEFSNLSEWQYGLASVDFRWNVSGTYQQVLPRYISVDEMGVEREFLLDYFSDPYEALRCEFLKGYEWPFDVRKIKGSSFIDLIVYTETVLKGRKVYMDFRREPTGLENGFDGLDETSYTYLKNSDALLKTPIERLRKMNPGAISLYLDHGIDIEKEPLKIAVCAQHNNGGVRVDKNWQSCVEGLYVVGEAAGTFGVFRPGGTALNSTQVGSLRAARHIAYCSNRKQGDFEKALRSAVCEAEELIEKTKGERATYKESRKRYRKEMSKNFAFLRNVPNMEQSKAVLQEYRKNFTAENKWSKKAEIPEIFVNYDIVEMQNAVSEGILTVAKTYGSRGSAFVYEDGDFMDRNPVPEQEEGRQKIVTVKKENGEIYSDIKDVKPIPERDLWFEKVWNEFKSLTEKKKD
ncbi:MAG: FAD-binding protein, partial [Clostridia bacterium]|nr:FAD-binding protein [Clostridia bacterium]